MCMRSQQHKEKRTVRYSFSVVKRPSVRCRSNVSEISIKMGPINNANGRKKTQVLIGNYGELIVRNEEIKTDLNPDAIQYYN